MRETPAIRLTVLLNLLLVCSYLRFMLHCHVVSLNFLKY
jgi:hypothetical protein